VAESAIAGHDLHEAPFVQIAIIVKDVVQNKTGQVLSPISQLADLKRVCWKPSLA
jgi:hypothetical protein